LGSCGIHHNSNVVGEVSYWINTFWREKYILKRQAGVLLELGRIWKATHCRNDGIDLSVSKFWGQLQSEPESVPCSSYHNNSGDWGQILLPVAQAQAILWENQPER
jgi:L-fucose isomerase-like protein